MGGTIGELRKAKGAVLLALASNMKVEINSLSPLTLESQENASGWMAYKCSAFRLCPRQGSIHPSIVLTSHLLLHQGRGPGTWFRGHAPHFKDRGNAYGNTCSSSASWIAAP